jgi:hypothetical protein
VPPPPPHDHFAVVARVRTQPIAAGGPEVRIGRNSGPEMAGGNARRISKLRVAATRSIAACIEVVVGFVGHIQFGAFVVACAGWGYASDRI